MVKNLHRVAQMRIKPFAKFRAETAGETMRGVFPEKEASDHFIDVISTRQFERMSLMSPQSRDATRSKLI